MEKPSMDSPIADEILRSYGRAAGARSNWESHWQEIAERVWPSHSTLFNQKGNQTKGEKRNNLIFDSTATIALSRFAAILDSLLTPQNQTWHRLVPSEPKLLKDMACKKWFENLNRLLFKHRYAPTANFTSQNQNNYKSLGAYGSGCLFIDELKGRMPGLRYRAVHLSEVYFFENHQGMVDSCIRAFHMTARQAHGMWGEKLPPAILSALKSNPDQEFEFVHCVKPRSDRDPERRDYKGMDWASYYVSVEGKMLLDEGGYDVFPYAISRYEQVPGEVYGRSPAMDVLPAIKTLNEQQKTVLKQGQRATDPVLLAYDDGIVDGFSMRPGALNPGGVSADGRPLVHALPTGNIAIGKDLMDDQRLVINDSFLVNLFQILVETPQMTATEVMERTKEKVILLAPTIGRQQSEYLGSMIDREINLLMRQGLVEPMPQILREAAGEYRVEYESPMSRSARSEEAVGLMRTIEMAMNVAVQTQNPEPLDHFKWDVIIPEVGDIQGLPAAWRNTPEEIAEIRAGREEAMNAQENIQAAPGAAALMKADAASKQAARGK
jgi:hypothetical protein